MKHVFAHVRGTQRSTKYPLSSSHDSKRSSPSSLLSLIREALLQTAPSRSVNGQINDREEISIKLAARAGGSGENIVMARGWRMARFEEGGCAVGLRKGLLD